MTLRENSGFLLCEARNAFDHARSVLGLYKGLRNIGPDQRSEDYERARNEDVERLRELAVAASAQLLAVVRLLDGVRP